MGGAQAGEVASGLAAAVLDEARAATARRGAGRRADPGGEPARLPALERGRGRLGHGDDDDRRARRRRAARSRSATSATRAPTASATASSSSSPTTTRSSASSCAAASSRREEAETHPQRSVITRALGTEPDVDVDTFTVEAEPGDVFLLCSDGLTDMVADARDPRRSSRQRDDLDAAARALVDAANAGGGEDNITVVLFEIADGDRRDGRCRAAAPVSRRRRGHALGARPGPGRRHGRDPAAAVEAHCSSRGRSRARRARPPRSLPLRPAAPRARRDRRCSPSGGSPAERADDAEQPRAAEPDRRRACSRRSASRASTSRAPSLVDAGSLTYAGSSSASTWSRTSSRAHRAVRRPVPAADGRAALGDRA